MKIEKCDDIYLNSIDELILCQPLHSTQFFKTILKNEPVIIFLD